MMKKKMMMVVLMVVPWWHKIGFNFEWGKPRPIWWEHETAALAFRLESSYQRSFNWLTRNRWAISHFRCVNLSTKRPAIVTARSAVVLCSASISSVSRALKYRLTVFSAGRVLLQCVGKDGSRFTHYEQVFNHLQATYKHGRKEYCQTIFIWRNSSWWFFGLQISQPSFDHVKMRWTI